MQHIGLLAAHPGLLHRPTGVCRQEFLSDILYYGMSPTAIALCCRTQVRMPAPRRRACQRWQRTARAAVRQERAKIFIDAVRRSRADRTRTMTLRQFIWAITDGGQFPPHYRKMRAGPVLGLAFVVVSVAFVLLSISSLIAASEPQFSTCPACDPGPNNTCLPTTESCEVEPFPTIEAVCVAWFTGELLLRVFAAPRRGALWLDPLTWIDLLAIVPFYITLGLSSREANRAAFVRALRLVRILRVFKLGRHVDELRVMGDALACSIREMSLLLLLLALGILIFASAIYFAEQAEPASRYTSIPDSFWWAIATMTTVGYGDYVPTTAAGRVIASVCALCGILVLNLPVPFLISNYLRLYGEYRTRKARMLAWRETLDRVMHDPKKIAAPGPAPGPAPTPAPPTTAPADPFHETEV
eukprot:m.260092 g.260092  ORF g.260092 m.260092 type:complete len:414 (+) comp23281_c0_seq1:40-1281(+)